MRLERYYRQTITYWAPNSVDGYGAPIFGSPIKFLGRWEEHSEDVIDPRGETVKTNSMVNYPQDLNIIHEGYLALGDFTQSPDPRKVATANKIQFLTQVPDLRGLEQANVAML